MKKLKTSDITNVIGMPIKAGTLDHLQSAYKELAESLSKNIIGNGYDFSKGYVLYGCVNSGSGSNYNISAGAVFYQGEIYLVDATTFTTSGGNVPVCTITTTYYIDSDKADPVIFTDTVQRNVHEIRKIVIASGASGSGTIDYSNFVFSIGWTREQNTLPATISTGNGTLETVDIRYKKTFDTAIINYKIEIDSIGSNNGFEVQITMPFFMSSSTDIFSSGVNLFDPYGIVWAQLNFSFYNKINIKSFLPIGENYSNSDTLILVGQIIVPL